MRYQPLTLFTIGSIEAIAYLTDLTAHESFNEDMPRGKAPKQQQTPALTARGNIKHLRWQ